MSSIIKDLAAISKIINKVGMLSKIQKETVKISSTARVTDGKHEDVDFDVVVKCSSKDFENVHRRLASMSDITTEKIAENILGVRERKHGK
jgi:hypothetical protein